MPDPTAQYWLFQSSPKVFRLQDALAADAVHSFAVKAHRKAIRKGDRVILWQSGKKAGCYALATVTSEPKEQDISAVEIPFFRQLPDTEQRVGLIIDYNLWNRPITKEIVPHSTAFNEFYGGIPGTNFKVDEQQFKLLVRAIEQLDTANEPFVPYRRTKPPQQALNTILQGPPGTGKTYQTVNYALSIIEHRSLKELAIEDREELKRRFNNYREKGQIQFLTFHQSYAYEDFVEGIKPSTQDGQIQYQIEEGIFKKICSAAKTALLSSKKTDSKTVNLSPVDNYVLIIDEINRGNIPSIFGELISLIEEDKRLGQPEAIESMLPYSKSPFGVPSNLYILGTMNTSDRSVAQMDMALRRRFQFIEMPPIPSLLRPAIEAGVNLDKLLTTLNTRIEALLDKDHLIGHAYFMNTHTLDDLIELFTKQIIPLLKAYFFGDINRIGLVLGKQFFKEKKSADGTVFSDFDADFVESMSYKKLYELKAPYEWKEADFIHIYDPNYAA
ncbi:MAG: AAA family ATPase [Bacteroidota bacterium]